jgi:hypothetical protein
MEHQLLPRFNADYHTKQAVLAFVVDHLKERIIENALAKKSTEGLADAIIEIEKAFEQLNELYDIKQTTRGGGGITNAK